MELMDLATEEQVMVEGAVLAAELLAALAPLAPVGEAERDALWARALEEWEQEGDDTSPAGAQ